MLRIFSNKISQTSLAKKRNRCLKKFLYYFPKGFADATYLAWERNYKWEAHLAWKELLNRQEYERLLNNRQYNEVSLRAVRLETKTNLLFSFEKMALRDAVKPAIGAKAFASGLYEYAYGQEGCKNALKILRKCWKVCQESKPRYLPGHCIQCLALLQNLPSIFL